jgi:hypothetical protein
MVNSKAPTKPPYWFLFLVEMTLVFLELLKRGLSLSLFLWLLPKLIIGSLFLLCRKLVMRLLRRGRGIGKRQKLREVIGLLSRRRTQWLLKMN